MFEMTHLCLDPVYRPERKPSMLGKVLSPTFITPKCQHGLMSESENVHHDIQMRKKPDTKL